MLITHTSLPQALISRSIPSSPTASPSSLSPEVSLPTESFVAARQEKTSEMASSPAVVLSQVAEVSPSPLPVAPASRPEAAPATLSLVEASPFSLTSPSSLGSAVADLAYAGLSQDSENPLFAFGNAWLGTIPKGEGAARGAVQAAILEKLSDGSADFAIEDVKGVLTSAASKLDRPEDLRILNDSLFKTLATGEREGNALETARQWKKSVPGGEPVVRNAITDTLLETFLNDPDGDLELSNFRPVFDRVMGRLEETDQRTATDAFFRVLSRESDSNLIEFGKTWTSRCEEEPAVRAAITDGIVDQLLTSGGEMEPAEFSQLYGKIQGRLSREEDLQVLNSTLFACLAKDSESSLIELGKAWIKEIPAGEKSARSAITDGVLEFFLKDPERSDLDVDSLPEIYQSVQAQVGHDDDLRLINDALLRTVSRESDSKLLEVGQGWLKAIEKDNRAPRAAVTDAILAQLMAEPGQDLEAAGLPALAKAAMEQAGHRYVADDVISGLLEYLAKGNDRKDLAALAKQPYSEDGLQRKIDALADLVAEA